MMMGLAAELIALVSGRKSDALRTFRAFARRDAEGGKISKADLPAIELALERAGLTATEFETLVEKYRQLSVLRKAAAPRATCISAANAAQLAHQQHIDKMKRDRLSAEARERELAVNVLLTQAAMQDAEAAQCELEGLESQLSGNTMALDDHTLQTLSNVISVSDPSAPYRYVTDAVFTAESHRRHSLMQDARKKAAADYNSACIQWTDRDNARRERGDLKQEPYPVKPDQPTWAEVVAALKHSK